MLWPRPLGRSGSQLFVTTKLIYRAIRSCIIEVLVLYVAIFRGPHFESGLVGVKCVHIFNAKIIVSHKDPVRSYNMWVLSCLWQYQLFLYG